MRALKQESDQVFESVIQTIARFFTGIDQNYNALVKITALSIKGMEKILRKSTTVEERKSNDYDKKGLILELQAVKFKMVKIPEILEQKVAILE